MQFLHELLVLAMLRQIPSVPVCRMSYTSSFPNESLVRPLPAYHWISLIAKPCKITDLPKGLWHDKNFSYQVTDLMNR